MILIIIIIIKCILIWLYNMCDIKLGIRETLSTLLTEARNKDISYIHQAGMKRG